MNKPEAWPKLERSDFERTLLHAAKADRVPHELGLRIASALSPGLVPSVAASPAATTAAHTAESVAANATPSVAPAAAVAHGGLWFSKAGLWGFLSLALLAGVGTFYATGSGASRAAVSTQRSNTSASQALASASLASAPAAPTIATPRAPSPSIAAAPAVQARPLSLVSSVASRDPSEALREEIGLLDRAREALERGATQRAFSALDQHQKRFARGTLVPEAEALRIEALVLLGETERAQRMSRRFLSAYPAHPLRERVSAANTPPPANPPPSAAQ